MGAGISGALMAHALADRYESVVVVDRRPPAQGSTLASTAMLQFEIDTPLNELRGKIGLSKAKRAWLRSFRATQNLISLAQDENIRCGLERKDSLYLAGNTLGSRGLLAECKERQRIGLPGEYLNGSVLRSTYGVERTGAIVSPGSAMANPVQLAIGLLQKSAKKGVKIYSPTQINDILATHHGVTVDAGAHFIQARYCIFCTGYETLKGISTSGTKITSSWAFATQPNALYPAWLDRTLVWEAADPYLYMRTTPDRRLIVGGEDEDVDLPTYRARSLIRKSIRLSSKAEALLPGTKIKISRRWTGAFGESADGLPIIDAVPGMPRCYTVMGFGGNGTIYSQIASEIMPTLLKGRPDEDADIYRFRSQ